MAAGGEGPSPSLLYQVPAQGHDSGGTPQRGSSQNTLITHGVMSNTHTHARRLHLTLIFEAVAWASLESPDPCASVAPCNSGLCRVSAASGAVDIVPGSHGLEPLMKVLPPRVHPKLS